ncbi:MAG: polyphosphate polymerase domain-containing protein [Bacteroidaceae bacterium]|nr:polyphosphate polymerase domain-containing protein [Bacteroidaceae bacterium]MBR2863872.1 polyphosphate polymerase domain-containing protein [Bacteroidaceae bacterium]
MEEYAAILHHLLEKLPPITLEEMSGIRLMNRTDCKYVTNVSTLAKLLELTQGSYYAQDRDGARICAYATTYWDTADGHDMFRTHHCGHSPRTKVRVRTYMDTQHTFLEVKRKNNHGKTSKKRVEVPSLQAVMDDRAGEEFLKERSGYTFDDLIPTLANRFQRITLVNYAKTERLTIDFDLHFFNHETGTEADMDSIVIIELKRDGRVSSPIVPLLRQLRVKPSGFSKYCIGSAVTNDRLRQNRFKKRLVRIRKVAAKNTEINNLESSTH